MQRNELISRNAVIEEFYKYIGSEFCVDDIRFIEKIIMGVPGIEKPEHEADFCEIIQMKCPYSNDCHVCRLYTDYERAREKSKELMEKSGKRLSNVGWI